MQKLCKSILNALIDTVFPPLCYYCAQDAANALFCQDCINLIELIDPNDHCRICFFPLENKEVKTCITCHYKRRYHAAIFEDIGPTRLIDELLQKDSHPRLIKLITSYIVIQLSHLNWEIDYLIKSVNYPYLSKQVAKVLQIPIAKKESKNKNLLYIGSCSNYHKNNQIYHLSILRQLP